ncbi:hypothetical protein, partial [Sporosarcina sp. E16_3]|uniref:hypothetical protein n=1 Tax=Sporosarcina sp. E16_3 TaxID=2789293 RepID=UPI001A92846F
CIYCIISAKNAEIIQTEPFAVRLAAPLWIGKWLFTRSQKLYLQHLVHLYLRKAADDRPPYD